MGSLGHVYGKVELEMFLIWIFWAVFMWFAGIYVCNESVVTHLNMEEATHCITYHCVK